MEIVSITAIRQDAAKILSRVKALGEPVLVVQRSHPAAYVVGVKVFEAMQAELKELRRLALLRDVAQAEKEVRKGKLKAYEDVDELLADLNR